MGNIENAGEGRRRGKEGRNRKRSWRYEQTLMSQAAGLWCDLTKRSARGAPTATLWNWLCTRACTRVCVRENRVAEASKCVILKYWSMFLPLNCTAPSRKWFLPNLTCSLAGKGFCACEQRACSISSDHVWFIKLEFNELSDHGALPLNQSHAVSWKSQMKVLLTTLSSASKFLPSTTRGSTDLFPI